MRWGAGDEAKLAVDPLPLFSLSRSGVLPSLRSTFVVTAVEFSAVKRRCAGGRAVPRIEELVSISLSFFYFYWGVPHGG